MERFFAEMVERNSSLYGDVKKNPAMDPERKESFDMVADRIRVRSGSTGMKAGRSKASMDMEQYKEYIYGKLCEIKIHPSLQETYLSIFISEEGLLRMKQDSAYEARILALISRDLGRVYPVGLAPEFCIIQVGETLEDYKATSAGSRDDGMADQEEKEKEQEWRKKQERKKRNARELERLILKRNRERKYLNKLAAERRMARTKREQALTEAAAMERAGLMVNTVELANAGRAFHTQYNKRELGRMY